MNHTNWDIAVLTGDFVASVTLSDAELDRAIAIIDTTVQSITGGVLTRLARSRGDGWQVAFSQQTHPLRVSLAITAALTAEDAGFSTRIAMATGSRHDTLPNDLNAATGPVFIASGRALDAMKGDQLITHATDLGTNACARLADAIAQTWTAAQARTALHLLNNDAPSRTEVAKRLGVSRQAVDKSAHGAQLPAILDALEMIETAP